MHYAWDAPMGTLTQDPLFRRPVYTGLLSQAGILLWAAAAGICFLTGSALAVRNAAPAIRHFFLAAGALTLLLGLDDAFMLHDVVLPDYLGIAEEPVYAVYGGLIVLFMVVFRGRILASSYGILAIAAVFFGLSVVADLGVLRGSEPFLLEDGTKIVGIVSWLTYFFAEARAALS